MSTLAKGTVLVVGGTGSIGSAIARKLLDEGYAVTVVSRVVAQDKKPAFEEAEQRGMLAYITCDVTNRESVLAQLNGGSVPYEVRGVVYAVGDCPYQGFDNEVKTPLAEVPTAHLEKHWMQQVIGLHNVVQSAMGFLSGMEQSHIVVIGSAITRVTDDICPPWLHAGHYASAKAAQAELVRWLRRDLRKPPLVHLISPGAVDTPFHQGYQHQPPALLPVSRVADEVYAALQSDEPVDKMLVSEQQQD